MMPERDFGYYYEDDTYGENGSDDVRTPEDDKSQDNKEEREKNIRFRHNEVRRGSVMTIILISAMAAVLLGTVIYSLDRRNTMYNRVSDKNHELSLVEADNVRLQSELESRVSAKNVEDYAENQLHMQKIDSSQIKYIKIQEGDVVNIPKQDKSVKAKIKGFFDDLVEYFRG
jgi:cell division protein FtsL